VEGREQQIARRMPGFDTPKGAPNFVGDLWAKASPWCLEQPQVVAAGDDVLLRAASAFPRCIISRPV